MIYPFTIIAKQNLPMMLNTLLALGYHCDTPLDFFLMMFKNTDVICVVVNNEGVFGKVWFYKLFSLDRNIPRDFIADEIKFLKECAKLKGETEF